MTFGFDQLRKQLALQLGLSAVADVPYNLHHEPGLTTVRLPGPNEFEIDGEPLETTRDVIGQGGDEEEAFKEAFSLYHQIAAELRASREGLDERNKYVLH